MTANLFIQSVWKLYECILSSVFIWASPLIHTECMITLWVYLLVYLSIWAWPVSLGLWHISGFPPSESLALWPPPPAPCPWPGQCSEPPCDCSYESRLHRSDCAVSDVWGSWLGGLFPGEAHVCTTKSRTQSEVISFYRVWGCRYYCILFANVINWQDNSKSFFFLFKSFLLNHDFKKEIHSI